VHINAHTNIFAYLLIFEILPTTHRQFSSTTISRFEGICKYTLSPTFFLIIALFPAEFATLLPP